MIKWILGLGGILVLTNEIRGLVMAGPILVAMIVTGPTWMQVLTLSCIAISVIVPVLIWRKINESTQADD